MNGRGLPDPQIEIPCAKPTQRVIPSGPRIRAKQERPEVLEGVLRIREIVEPGAAGLRISCCAHTVRARNTAVDAAVERIRIHQGNFAIVKPEDGAAAKGLVPFRYEQGLTALSSEDSG